MLVRNAEKLEPLVAIGVNAKWCSHYGKQCGGLLRNLKIEIPYDLAIPLLGTYLKEMEPGP